MATSSFALSEAEHDMVKHVIDVRVLEELQFSQCSIYKVPCNLRKVNEEAYTPQLISIGPIHFGRKELKPMQEHKQRYFHSFCESVSNEQAMKNYKQHLETREQEIRQCYAQKLADSITKEILVDMMLLDAVFIMELLLRNSSFKSHNVANESFRRKHGDDIILTQPWLSKNITRELILLENQIPFFVLSDLYETVVPDDKKKQEHPGFLDLAREYFAFYDTQRSSSSETRQGLSKKISSKHDLSGSRRGSRKHDLSGTLGGSKKHGLSGTLRGSKRPTDKNEDRGKSPKHFTDLIRFFYLPADRFVEFDCPDSFLRTATKLQDAGVSFEKVLKRRLLDMTFEKKLFLSSLLCLGCIPYLNHFKARFRIPQLKVDHTTECVLRNLIAFEQCHYPGCPYICNYVSLVDSLIHTQADVELLVEEEVIVHELGSYKEVATLVNGLCKHVETNTTCYYKLINELNKHYQNAWNKTMAALWLVYFRDPWRASSTVVGIAVLIFTVFNFLRALDYILYKKG